MRYYHGITANYQKHNSPTLTRRASPDAYIIFYCLISENGEMYSKVALPYSKNIEPKNSKFIISTIGAKVIPDNVRFIPN